MEYSYNYQPNKSSDCRKKWYAFIGLIVTAILMAGCYTLLDNRVEVEKKSEASYYTYDPETILRQLRQGKTDVFRQLSDSASTPSMPLQKASWSQEDYLMIVRALYQQFWPEKFESQKINYLNFKADCSEIDQNLFSEVTLRSNHIYFSGKEETRVDHYIHLLPSYHSIFLTRGEYTPNVNKKKSIDVAHYHITAEEALQIAEKNGGIETRLNYKNQCIVDVEASQYFTKGWVIYYQIRQDDAWWKVFEIKIDAQSGAFTVLLSKQ